MINYETGIVKTVKWICQMVWHDNLVNRVHPDLRSTTKTVLSVSILLGEYLERDYHYYVDLYLTGEQKAVVINFF